MRTACDLEIDPLLDKGYGLLVLFAILAYWIIVLTSWRICFLKEASVSLPTLESSDLFKVGLITVVITGGDWLAYLMSYCENRLF